MIRHVQQILDKVVISNLVFCCVIWSANNSSLWGCLDLERVCDMWGLSALNREEPQIDKGQFEVTNCLRWEKKSGKIIEL